MEFMDYELKLLIIFQGRRVAGKQLQQQQQQRPFQHEKLQQLHANRELLEEGYKNRDAVEK